MPWTDLPTNYTDAVWDGLKRYLTVNNDDGTVSFEDVTVYTAKENSFFGAMDANSMNEAMNNLVAGIPSNPNQLIGADFPNNPNQRAQSVYDYTAGSGYSVDRWLAYLLTVTVTADGVQLQNANPSGQGHFYQYIEKGEKLYGKEVSISVKAGGIVYKSEALVVPGIAGEATSPLSIPGGTIAVRCESGSGRIYFSIFVDSTVTLNWAKIELGPLATPFVPRPFAEELALCQRYALAVQAEFLCRAAYMTPDVIDFLILVPSTLRTTPTIINQENLEIRSFPSGSVITGFSFDVRANTAAGFRFRGAKASHGLSDASLRNSGGVLFDAEIY